MLLGNTATIEDCARAEAMLRANYGVDYPTEKFDMLWTMVIEDGWTTEKLQNTVKWFLKNKKYPNWTISDWFDYQVKLFPYSWYLKQVNEFGGSVNQQLEKYRIGDKILYKYADGNELPFERVK